MPPLMHTPPAAQCNYIILEISLFTMYLPRSLDFVRVVRAFHTSSSFSNDAVERIYSGWA